MTHLAVHIRPARLSDVARLAVLATQVWLHTYATEGVSDEIAQYVLAQFTPSGFENLLGDPAIRVEVAEHGGNLTGFAVIHLRTPCPEHVAAVAELQTLYVQAHFIGKGIGKHLLEAAQRVAQQEAGSTLWLTVNAQNQRAMAFYEHCGYHKVGTSWFELGNSRHENHVLIGKTN